MTKKDDYRLRRLEDWKIQKQTEDGIRKGITTRILAICVTATGAALTAMGKLGAWAYDNWPALQIAVDAFNKASGRQ